MSEMEDIKIGFIGQGWIGKNFADDFDRRGFETVRYALEEPYVENKDKIRTCDLVFIAVPTPTTHEGFSCEAVIDSLTHLDPGTTAIVKSTILPGTTKRLQELFPKIYVLHSPEFLLERTAQFNVQNPERNLIGIPVDDETYRAKAKQALSVMPTAPYEKVMDSNDAELVKYAGNTILATKLLFMNILYDLVEKSDGDWESVREAVIKDTRIGGSHTTPVFQNGRGAGGNCLLKDFEALRQMYMERVGDEDGKNVLNSLTKLNINLLTKTNKSLDILSDIFEFNIKE